MANYKLSELADEDIQEIAAKTLTTWGFKQTRIYLETLHKAMLMLADTPSLGKSREELFTKAKSFPVGKHIVFYKRCSDGIEVAESYINIWII
ncbi:type II toxin-antitoxin system RelE/ParE family toxin [Alkalimonas mucilaginosa]|uniref:Toxin n=1 Tax=Alkalimonas mucilaginosa TaxID=3057676 RepID=A0ABU7JC44_9GAMM|nr:type II toxin-antitoxin system RelE/ParE family toxin [Alkalimonas sp. MEB004]MEE2023267.1 type II toxin-antitoxin system RelE/ParE family toxin [Alkalimonas sp. MEB004]